MRDENMLRADSHPDGRGATPKQGQLRNGKCPEKPDRARSSAMHADGHRTGQLRGSGCFCMTRESRTERYRGQAGPEALRRGAFRLLLFAPPLPHYNAAAFGWGLMGSEHAV